MPGYFSEIDYSGGGGDQFIEIAIPEGTDVSSYSVVLYKGDGRVETTYSFDASTQNADGHDVYLLDSSDPGWKSMSPIKAVALIDDAGNVLQFASFEGNTVTATEGPADGETSTSIGTASSPDESLETDDGGSSYFLQSSPNPGTIPCYAVGTQIDTPDGPRPVEDLRRGDSILTLDHGARAVLWVRRGRVPLDGAGNRDDSVPVLIRAGALGSGRPTHDLVVSPQHRILVGSHGQLPDLFDVPRLVPAKALTGMPRIRRMHGKRQVDWVHVLCERHELLCAAGAYAESLLLGPMILNRLTRLQRRGLEAAFPPAAVGQPLNGPPARPILRVGEARRLLERPASAPA